MVAQTIRLRVEVEDDGIIVTLPGTTFHVIYHTTPNPPGLVASAIQTDKSAGIAEFDFLARACGRNAPRRRGTAGTFSCRGETRRHDSGSHDGEREFETEDLRVLESLARFASVAYQAIE